ncbi:GNAT family N-acetyltransferase [Tabrizicola oligotrophica]|uniref:GNAT family N-acetyltransferase n=1 Tax=Tabrizicola oligotrophica TaxID=2710650 RepID=A0A6M0QU18_9RHOB|nr:GNAT family N-acetyltransferase [Tabrizicola oligotrophica]NEY90887.1 GNAT family N-acetyltransferase [Tabrizicola oligotrophica]
MRLTISQGLPDHLIPAAAALYWQAFGGKLGRVMGPDARALRFLERVIRADQALVALDERGRLLGLAGFKTPEGSFAGGAPADLRAIYGLAGTAWRMPLLSLLSREVDNDRFLLDGICVAPAARSKGVGRALLSAIEDEARARGYDHVRLDVVDSNWRARALYERLGYRAVKTDSIGLLRHVFGFDAAVTMVKPV